LTPRQSQYSLQNFFLFFLFLNKQQQTHIMSSTTKLPAIGDSSWGVPLNDFLSQALVASTTASADNGLLKEDHAAITKGGKVGVGIALPTNKLHVKDTTNPVKIEGLVAGVATDDVVTIDSTGIVTKTPKSAFVPTTGTFNKVGTTTPSIVETDDVYHTGKVVIGTNNPGAKLDVRGGANFEGTDGTSHFNLGTTEDTYIRPGKAAGTLILNDYGTGNTLLNFTGGNVGIGTNNTPTTKLEVNGEIKSTSIDATGNVTGGMRGVSFLQFCNLNIPNNGVATKLFGIRDIANAATNDIVIGSGALIRLRITAPNMSINAMLSTIEFGGYFFYNIAVISKSEFLGAITISGNGNDVLITNNGTGPIDNPACIAEVIKLF
jgi:hypothetical protein